MAVVMQEEMMCELCSSNERGLWPALMDQPEVINKRSHPDNILYALKKYILLPFIFVLLTSCGQPQVNDHTNLPTTAKPDIPPIATPNILRVLVWNVWNGANNVDDGPEKAVQLIKDSKADICLLQESYDINGPRSRFGLWAAQELGWNAWPGGSSHLGVISRYKIKKTFFLNRFNALGAELEDDKGRTIHAFSAWLTSAKYTPWELRDNPKISDADLLAGETTHSGRHRHTKEILASLEKNELMSLKTPLLVGGDWNCPSHLDWTEATSKAFDYRRPLPLPVSKTMEDAGFKDTYRSVYPDPVKYPGNTWSPLLRTENGVALPMDRIDRLYFRSTREVPMLKPVRAIVYPEILEDDSIPARKRQFPSDHAALLIEFKWNESDKK